MAADSGLPRPAESKRTKTLEVAPLVSAPVASPAMAAIVIEGLRKTYRGRKRTITALDGLDLVVPEGGVFGFLGPNGAGKTTAIRALVGHLRADSGTCRVLGADAPGRLATVIDDVGVLVESPGFFGRFSGKKNLSILARSRRFSQARVDEVLATVGLTDRADDQVRRYSLGMRQRLGVAAALLKDPKLVILDEPANGLDPVGIREMREMLRRLGAEGRTVFVSSHILAEVEQACDRVAVLTNGRCVAEGTVDELLAGQIADVHVRVPQDPAAAVEVLRGTGFVVQSGTDGELIVACPPGEEWKITEALSRREIFLTEMQRPQRSLEEAFFELIGEAE